MENMKENDVRDVAVVGLGPAGITAVSALAAWGYRPDAYEVGLAGGMVNQTAQIDNYPGFVGSGMELAGRFEDTLKRNSIVPNPSSVKEIASAPSGLYELSTAKGKRRYRTVIVATGTHYRDYSVPGMEQIKGRGFSRCAICDGPLYRGKDVAVVGGGNSAFEEGVYLASICRSVTLIHRRDAFRAPERIVSMFQKKANAKVLVPRVAVSCRGEGKLEALVIRNPDDPSSKEEVLPVSACFVYIGSDPSTSFVKIGGALDSQGYLAVDEDMASKEAPGLFGCGDCVQTPLRQVATAVGSGAKAADSAIRYLKRKEREHE